MQKELVHATQELDGLLCEPGLECRRDDRDSCDGGEEASKAGESSLLLDAPAKN